jgi:predicted NAD/FAD-dependent oxidoreductase
MSKLAIVGAGIAGLAAAQRLRALRPELEAVVFEKDAGAGGRAATRRLHGATFDYGAQYLKTPTPELQRFVTDTLDHTTLADIDRPVWTFDGSGQIREGDPAQNADPKWTYTDGIARLATELAGGVDIRYATSVRRLGHDGQSWLLYADAPNGPYHADAVLLTPPAPQTRELLGRSELPNGRAEELLRELAQATYRPCLSVTLGYERPPRPRPWYAMVNTDRKHPISWLAYEHLKPDRHMAGQGVVIAQMAPVWSHEHRDDTIEALAATVANQVSTLLDEELRQPHWADREFWPYALPDHGCDGARLHTGDGLFFAGDYLLGQGRLHLAIESGWAAAQQIDAYFSP